MLPEAQAEEAVRALHLFRQASWVLLLSEDQVVLVMDRKDFAAVGAVVRLGVEEVMEATLSQPTLTTGQVAEDGEAKEETYLQQAEVKTQQGAEVCLMQVTI